MFEKLLLAATITFSLNLFIGLSVQPTRQSTIVVQENYPSVYLAKAPHNRPSLLSLFE